MVAHGEQVDSKVSERVVLITGASSGIGAAAAAACARDGHALALTARREARLVALRDSLPRPERVAVIAADLALPDAPLEVVEATLRAFGRVDVLVANAGLGYWEPFPGSADEHLTYTFAVNVLAVARLAREVLPGMLERGSGHLLTVSSVAGEIPTGNAVAYGASKGAVHCLTDALRREVAGRGIHVTEVIPGFIRTEMTEHNSFPMPPASAVGDRIARLIRRPRRRAVIPRWYGAAIWANRFAPGLVDLAMAAMVRSLERTNETSRQP